MTTAATQPKNKAVERNEMPSRDMSKALRPGALVHPGETYQVNGKDFVAPRHPNLPTPEEIDKRLNAYAELELAADQAEKHRAEFEKELIPFIRKYGNRSEGATQSWTLRGTRNEAMATFGMTRSTIQPAIVAFRDFMVSRNFGVYFHRMFERSVSYTMVKGAREILSKVVTDDKTLEKALTLFGSCSELKDQKPKLKVAVIKVKPAKKARGSKAAA